MIKLTFLGADHEVTGSMHLLETPDLYILVDCGMQQGADLYKNAPLPIPYSDLDYIILTHAHIDHSGMIPHAVKNGFCGTVLTTSASAQLDRIMLLDSAHIQEQDAENASKKAKRAGKEAVEPAYTVEDAEKALKHFDAVPYGEIVELSDSTKLRFTDAGHLLGSASAELWVTDDESGETRKLVFSGDIGNKNKPLIKDPSYITEADYVLCESTYGNRVHEEYVDHTEDLARIIQETLDRGGNVLLPAFAVGRTQELLFMIRHIKQNGLVTGHGNWPVYVDSPLAVEATQVFSADHGECYDEETAALVRDGVNPISFMGLRLSVSSDDSKEINYDKEPKVIIAAAGMCNAGRIRYHLKYNVWRPDSTVVFAGYQAEGTLGRKLQDGAKKVAILGDDYAVKARIETLPDMSSHADAPGLLEWIGAYEKAPKKLFLVHGDDDAMAALCASVREKFGYEPDCPFSGSVFDCVTGTYDYRAEPAYVNEATGKSLRNEAHRTKLEDALKRLAELVTRQLSGTNADIDSLAEAIDSLVDKYNF